MQEKEKCQQEKIEAVQLYGKQYFQRRYNEDPLFRETVKRKSRETQRRLRQSEEYRNSQREYMANRRLCDPEFKEACRLRQEKLRRQRNIPTKEDLLKRRTSLFISESSTLHDKNTIIQK